MGWTLDYCYGEYPTIEDDFAAALDTSLNPRGPDVLYDLVAELGLPTGAVAVDVGCGEGGHAVRLARRFGFAVTGVDPVARHVEVTRAAGIAAESGTADRLPLADASVDLVWCRDVLVHVTDLVAAFREFRRVLAPGGRVLTYQMFRTDRMEPGETAWLCDTMGVVAASVDPVNVTAAIAAAGLVVERSVPLGTEWGEWSQERDGRAGRKLLHAARLLHGRDGYVERFGQAAYDLMLGDCLWHVYGMIGKLTRHAFVLSTAD